MPAASPDGGGPSARVTGAAADWLGQVRFGPDGLVPVVVSSLASGDVLMLAYASAAALERTVRTGQAWFWSRSRDGLWEKGATSGNRMRVAELVLDCDGDAVLYRVEPSGPACHTGEETCFHRPALRPAAGAPRESGRPPSEIPRESGPPPDVLAELGRVLAERRRQPEPGSYVAGLYAAGLDAVLRKVSEEATEVVLAAKDADAETLVAEVADLWFHSLVALAWFGREPSEVLAELGRRRGRRRAGDS